VTVCDTVYDGHDSKDSSYSRSLGCGLSLCFRLVMVESLPME
jgi:hypothetical protein